MPCKVNRVLDASVTFGSRNWVKRDEIQKIFVRICQKIVVRMIF